MTKISPRFALAAAALAALAIPAAAHHSTAMFEWGKAKPLENMTVQRWEWTNPHTFLYATDAEGNKWAFEGMSPNHLVRYGWSKRSLKPGDKIDMTYYPLRDGRRGGFDVTVHFSDGSSLNQFGEAGSRTANAN
ncbi:DUF6152 family protein [Croceibacterium aestuarii]|uniref:DUF6152 family protein n=1 Tax=Croceibacterium aestuarii TaxID=3064139 RepID=UPI00272E3462|nr:DUF6152 family protein [Croceibacterium sp. D39]